MCIEFWGTVDVEDEEVAKKYKSHKKWKEGVYKRMETRLIYLYPSQVYNPKLKEPFQYKLDYEKNSWRIHSFPAESTIYVDLILVPQCPQISKLIKNE